MAAASEARRHPRAVEPLRSAKPLDASFYARPAELVARELLGALVISTLDGVETAGAIVETEAYVGPHDPASHAAARIGRTVRNRSMFGAPGIAYIYRIYGVHWCLNLVTDKPDYPAAVLIRALEPLRGLDTMRLRRARSGILPGDTELCSGPGKLAAALGVTGELDGHPLQRSPLMVARGRSPEDSEIGASPRIGVTRAADWPLRFFVRGNAHVSRSARGTARAP